MAMVVKNNMGAVSTLNTLNKNSAALQKSLSRVSSGMKINSAQDDASGYAISERMRVQIRSLDQANQNTQNGSSLMKTAEGAVANTVEILKSLKEKAINAATDTNTDSDRVTIQKEIDQFIDQIDDNALTTFNGKYLVDGSKSQQGVAVATSMTNQSLDVSTKGTDKLVDLMNRNGESLEIAATDSVTASFVKNGQTYTTKFKVEDKTLDHIFNALEVEGGKGVFENVGEAEMTYADALDKVKAASNTDFAKIIAGDDDADSDLKRALKTVYSTNVDGETAATGVTDQTDYISAGLISAKTAIAAKLDAGKGTAVAAAQGGYQVAASHVAIWQDKDATTNAANKTTARSTWNAGGGEYQKNDGYDAFINDAVAAAAAWGKGEEVQGVKVGSAAEAAAKVLGSFGQGADATPTAYAIASGQAQIDFNYEADIVDNLAHFALMEEAAAKVSGINGTDGKLDSYHATYVDTTDLTANAGIDTSAMTQAEAYAAKEAHTLTNEKLEALGVTITGDTATADEIKTALDVAVTAANAAGTFGAAEATAGTNALDAADYVASRAKYIASTSGYIGTAGAIQDNKDKAYQALDKADALYNAWQAAKDTTEDPDAEEAAATETLTAAYVTSSEIVGTNSFGDDVKTANGEKGLTIKAANAEVKNQISGLTISITDSEGNVKKAANAALDDFNTTIYAKNKSDRNELTFQVGAAANQAITVGLEDMRSEALGLKGSDGSKVSVATQDKANAAVAVFDNAIQKALDQQTTIGAVEARLEYTSTNLTTMSENVQGAESTIRDADMAKEMTNYTKNNVLLQAAQSMLAQANQSSSAVLSLLQ